MTAGTIGDCVAAVRLVCLDLEGVLVPEVWIAFAEATGIPELRRTTRDEPCYHTLMRYRLEILDRHALTLADVQRVIAGLRPLPGANEFMEWLRSQVPVIILSDTFAQFAGPLLAQIGHPTLFCHELVTDDRGRITDYRLRLEDQKRRSVEALRALNFDVIAAGDSYNDLSMIEAANHGILFRPPPALRRDRPQYPVADDHTALRAAIERVLATPEG